MRQVIFALAALAWATPALAADLVLATPEQGAAVVLTDDEFTAALSPADLSIRLRQPSGEVDQLQTLYAGEVQPWNDAERARLQAMSTRLAARVGQLASWLPETVLLVKNTDRLDGGLPHTRGNAIFFGPGLPADDAALDQLFFHELFHVLSRHATRQGVERQEQLYGLIGFQRCTTIDIPADLRAMMFTNPDAPVVNYVAPLGAEGRWLTPVLVGEPAQWNPEQTRFTSYFQLRFYAFTRGADGSCTGAEQIEAQQALPALFAVAGNNTQYVLHAEELMADNFAQLTMGRADAPNPEVQQRIAQHLGYTPPSSN